MARRKGTGRGSVLSGVVAFSALLVLMVFLFQLAVYFVFGSGASENVQDAALSLAFPATALAYLYYYKGLSPKRIVKSLGLGRKSITLRNVAVGIALFLAIFALEEGVGLLSAATNTQINTGVSQLLAQAPLWYLVFATFAAPIDEELLFRGLMVPRIGIVLSAVAFALPHWTYNSTFQIEVISACVFGLLAGYAFKRTKSLYPSIIAHILVNALSVVATVAMVV